MVCQIKKDQGFKILAYNPLRSKTIKDNITFHLFSKINFDNGVFRPFRILRSMSVDRFIQPNGLKRFLPLALIAYRNLNHENKYDLVDLTLEDILVGDLIYDWHLRQRLTDTVNMRSDNFKADFLFFVCNFYWWQQYFQSNKVDSIYISHTALQFALPARIAIKYGAKSFLAANDRMYKIHSDRLWSDLECLDYVPMKEEQLGYRVNMQRSRLELQKLREGKAITAAHDNGNGYLGSISELLVKDRYQTNILIAVHCFSDAPHGYGKMLFPDFREWLNNIGELSKKTNYHFYAKAHPHFWDSDEFNFKKFLNDYQNIIDLPSNISNLELFKQGINAVFTVHGTIAFEAAYEGIFVLNGSLNAPHINYDFSLTPKTIDEFNQTVLNLPEIIDKWKVNRSSVEHFFDLHHLRKNQNFMFPGNTKDLYEYIGGYKQQFTNPKVFEFWLSKIDYHQREKVRSIIAEFIEGSEYLLIS